MSMERLRNYTGKGKLMFYEKKTTTITTCSTRNPTYIMPVLNLCICSERLVNNFLHDGITFNPLNAGLIPIFHLLASLGAHNILHVSSIRVNLG